MDACRAWELSLLQSTQDIHSKCSMFLELMRLAVR